MLKINKWSFLTKLSHLTCARDFGISGNETKKELDANVELKKQLEIIRLQMGKKMNLGDVQHQSIPKMCLISPPRQGGLVNT